ncbi:hypothetical protein M422DRAFT_28192 [Sphaerobolus stellatus SS14]|nr:hypothetical protein M422DRAFT_28192 [Sphaerobolus stellatus SS14]
MASLSSIIASEDALVQEAALALPHSFDNCTHELGAIKQHVHLCLTCRIPRGLCSACAVACHGDHEQVELFPKRAFTCDCPTRVGDHPCTLYKGTQPVSTNNKYGQNFHAKFCRCHRPYDAKKEKETMVQCLACEDWFHESCLNLRTRPNEKVATPPPADPPAQGQETHEDDGDSTASNDLPSALLPASAYDSFICGPCVLSNDTLRRWAGTNGVMMVFRNADEELPTDSVIEEGGVDLRWKVLDDEGNDEKPSVDEDSSKRPLDEENAEDRESKRLKTDDGTPVATSATCLAPPLNLKAQKILNKLASKDSDSEEKKPEIIGHGDIFLIEGWRERWCRCNKCITPLQECKFLLEEEETYEPPEDPDSGKSLVDLGMRALLNLPRDRAIDGIMAYNNMRDELISYLRPFAEEGRVVREEDVKEFFEAKAQAAKEQTTKG